MVLRELVREEPVLLRLREQVRRLPPDASYFDRVVLGERTVRALERKRAEDARAILRRLGPAVVEHRLHPDGEPRLALDVSILVKRSRREGLERSLRRVSEGLSGRIRVRAVGPLPPWSFVDVPVGAR